MRAFTLLPLLVLASCTGAEMAADDEAPQRRRTANVVYGEDLVTAGDMDIERSLAARVPGLDMRFHNGQTMLIIRGINTIMGDPRPLYVVDGMTMGRESGSPLRMLNIYDIDRIEVLKGAGDTALYGVQGGNGVIRIWTRRPPLLEDDEPSARPDSTRSDSTRSDFR